jgi:hypothetical protein
LSMSALKSALVCAVFLGLITQAVRPVADEQAQVKLREELPTAIGEAIRLLEAKEYENFLTSYFSPDVREQLAALKMDMAAAVNDIKGAHADAMLRALKSLKHRTPKYEKYGTVAVFPVEAPWGSTTLLTFVKVGKYWYIKN